VRQGLEIIRNHWSFQDVHEVGIGARFAPFGEAKLPSMNAFEDAPQHAGADPLLKPAVGGLIRR
jgi:hypothetical protein